jgi:hypothetical protein
MLPFTRDQFFAVFADYNLTVWPAQLVAYLMGLAVVAALWKPSGSAGRIVGTTLGVMWVWTGVAYHALHFSAINRAAWVFGALFVAQGIALLVAGSIDGRLRFVRRGGAAAGVGALLMVYAMVVYPLIGLAAGHRPAQLPMFGITPCPLTIFTFGVLLWARPPLPWWLLAVPLAWSLIGGSAAFLLGVPQDWLLLVGGIAVAALLYRDRGRRIAQSQRPHGAR